MKNVGASREKWGWKLPGSREIDPDLLKLKKGNLGSKKGETYLLLNNQQVKLNICA